MRIFPLLLLLFSGALYADPATVHWTAADVRVDGTPITNLAGFNIYYVCTDLGTETERENVPDPAATMVTITETAPWPENSRPGGTALPDDGMCHFVGTEYLETGEEAAASNPVSRLMGQDPPSELVTVDVNAYTLLRSPNLVELIQVGTVPLGVPCDITQNYNGHNLVDFSRVSWLGSVESETVFVLCQ